MNRKLAVGDVVLKEGETGETAYYIKSGKVEVSKEKDGRKVHIAYLEAGATFGEMSMVDDLPRSASVTAVEETVVTEFHRDELFVAMRDNPEVFGKFLKSIIERLREANRLIAALDPGAKEAAWSKAVAKAAAEAQPRLANLREPGSKDASWTLEGLTPEAVAALRAHPAPITTFPFRIGRRSDDPFLYNHLEIEEQEPAQIARHHVSLVWEDGRIGVQDRGSEKGASVDGVRIGGKHGAGPAFFAGREGVLVLGDEGSPFRYRIKVAWS